MKSAVAATAAGFLAVANAYQPRNFHWRRDNETVISSSAAPAPEGFTTLTVEITEIATVTSCKPTITDCAAVSSVLPEEELEVVIVTNTVVLTETVCPISEAEEIESSVIQEHETGSLIGSTRTEPASAPFPTLTVPVEIPLSTGPSAPAVTTSDAIPVEGEEVVTEVDEVETTATLTLTLGRGETQSVVETVVTSTFQTTVVKTITACPGGCQGGEQPQTTKTPGAETPAEDDDVEVPPVAEEEEEEFTTTTTATTTGYTTVTVTPEATTDDNSPDASTPPTGGNNDSVDNGIPGTCAGSGEQCLCPTGPAAVTVTIPASTVYVTISGSEAGPTEAPSGGNDSGNGGKPGNGSNDVDDSETVEEDEEDVDEDECPVDEEDDEEEDLDEDDEDDEDDVCDEEDIVTVEQTVTVEPIPYPTGANNGTQPSGVPAPTGAPYLRYRNAN